MAPPPLPLLSCPSTRPPALLNPPPLPLERRAYSCSHVCGICARGARQPHQGRGGKRRRGNLSKVTLARATLLGNVGGAILAGMGNYGQRVARLGSAKRQKTFLRPFTVRLPLFSAETMNASHFGLGLSRLVRNFFFAPFHKVTKSTLELDMRTRSQPWRVADFLRQDTCPGNVSHAFLLLEKSDICF